MPYSAVIPELARGEETNEGRVTSTKYGALAVWLTLGVLVPAALAAVLSGSSRGHSAAGSASVTHDCLLSTMTVAFAWKSLFAVRAQ